MKKETKQKIYAGIAIIVTLVLVRYALVSLLGALKLIDKSGKPAVIYTPGAKE